jgi:hypothetical protein
MSENLAEQVIRPSYEQIVMGSIRHSGVQEILRRAQEGTLEVTSSPRRTGWPLRPSRTRKKGNHR